MTRPSTPSLSFFQGVLRIFIVLGTVLIAIIYLAVKFYLWKERR